jgi:hypothetical protein
VTPAYTKLIKELAALDKTNSLLWKVYYDRIYNWFFLAIWTVSVILKKEAEYPPPKVALLHTVRVLIADRLPPGRACFLLTH